MKSFYTVDELTDVSLTITFTLPTFLGLGPSAMTSAILSVTCMDPNGTNLGVVENTITTITAGASVEVTLAGSLFVGTDDTSGNEFSMIQDDGKFIIKIYNNDSDTEDNLLVRKEVSINLENLAVATKADELTEFEAVNIDPEAISGGSTSTVKMKVPCNKIFTMTNKSKANPNPFRLCGYGKDYHPPEDGYTPPQAGPVGSNIVFIKTDVPKIYKLGFMKNMNGIRSTYSPLGPDIPDEAPVTELNTSHCFAYVKNGLGNDITGMFFKLNSDPNSYDYIMRLDSSNVGPLSMDDYVLYYSWTRDEPSSEYASHQQRWVKRYIGNYDKQRLRDVINNNNFNHIVWTITPRSCP